MATVNVQNGPVAGQANVTASDVELAAVRLGGVARRTPLERNARLSAQYGAEVYLKREDLQPVRSYKIRGAYNLISQLPESERAAGVVCASAGNHGQGVALACATLGIKGRIFVPNTTPRQKRERMIALGDGAIELTVTGDNYDAAAAACKAAAAETGATIVPAFDDPRTAAGQGTVAIEVLAQMVEQTGKVPDTLLVPIGGGGLLAGCVAYLSERRPHVKIIGIEPAGAACMAAAYQAGEPVTLAEIDTFVDGAAVRRAGDVTFGVVDRQRPPLLAVPEGKICSEMLALYQVDGIVSEPAGALATAALGLYTPEPGERIVAIISGGNNDVSRYSEVVERSLLFEGRKHYFLVSFPQEPGALRRFLDGVLGPDDDIAHFEYVKRSNREIGPALVGIELADAGDYPGLLERMRTSGPAFEVVDTASPLYRFLV